MSSYVITGVTGQVAESVAITLAADHEVTGLARFNDGAARTRLEQAGVRCVPVDLRSGDFAAVPTGVDALVNFARRQVPALERRPRGERPGSRSPDGHVRPAAMLHCSSTGVYDPAGATVLDESAPLGTTTGRSCRPIRSRRSRPKQVVATSVAKWRSPRPSPV